MAQRNQDISALIGAAIGHHRGGTIDEARKLYERVLRIEPREPNALHLLGLLLCTSGETKRGVELMRRAIAVQPEFPEALSNLGSALEGMGRKEEALASFDKALAIEPGYAAALYNRGNVLLKLGRNEEALADFDRALTLRPYDAEAMNNRGIALQGLGRLEEALASYRNAVTAKPDFAGALINLGNALKERGSHEPAVASFDRALALKPDNAEALKTRGDALSELGRDEEALISFDRALAMRPDYFEALNNRGNTLMDLGRYREALASFDRALAIEPGNAEALYNRANALRTIGSIDEAVTSYRRALAIDPDNADARFNKSLCHLVSGDFERGWEEYEWRWRIDQMRDANRNFAEPLWLGKEELVGRTILLHAEQGFGDTLQFCRYVPLVAERGATVILEVPEGLDELLRSLSGIAQIVIRGRPLPAFDVHCPLMSLPLAFGTRLETIPAEIPYLRADAQRAAKWRERVARLGGLKLGLVWAGNARSGQLRVNRVDRRRSMRLDQLSELATVAGVTFVSLQKGEPAAQARTWRSGSGLVDWTEELSDFADTAALIEALDLIISVDTSVAHLAGALGKQVWLLSRYDHCWRWLTSREDSPWYPTMRLFTQASPGDWAGVMTRVSAELRRMVVPAGSPSGR